MKAVTCLRCIISYYVSITTVFDLTWVLVLSSFLFFCRIIFDISVAFSPSQTLLKTTHSLHGRFTFSDHFQRWNILSGTAHVQAISPLRGIMRAVCDGCKHVHPLARKPHVQVLFIVRLLLYCFHRTCFVPN